MDKGLSKYIKRLVGDPSFINKNTISEEEATKIIGLTEASDNWEEFLGNLHNEHRQ